MNWRLFRKRAVEATTFVEYATDARRSEAGERAAPDPEARNRRRLHRRAVQFLLGGIGAAGILFALLGDGGYFDLLRVRGESQAAQQQLELQRARVQALHAEVKALRDDPAAMERIAREQLGLAEEGEVLFLLPELEKDPTGDESAAK